MKGKMKNPLFLLLLAVIMLNSCIENDFSIPNETCDSKLSATVSIGNVYDLTTEEAVKYTNEDVLEGYVVSNDQEGNFYKYLSIQSLDGSRGFTIPVDQTDLYTIYNPGRKVLIKLKDNYTELDDGALQIGSLYIDYFHNETVGRMAYPSYENSIVKSCTVVDDNTLVTTLSFDEISDERLHTFVEFTDVQFTQDALNHTFYDSANDSDEVGSSNFLLENSSGATLSVNTSSYASFASTEIPEGSGSIRGILTKKDEQFVLVPRSLNDINLNQDRFDIIIKNNVFFTELADPNNNAAARFIEIYNGEEVAVNLNGWTIRRYTNDNPDYTSTINLSGYTINAGEVLVIAAQATEFEAVFGFPPDIDAGTNSPADSNGDDNLALVDVQGTVVDVFGIPGEDGSGTNHEFEDGRALRNSTINHGNPVYTFSEWQVWNDTGGAGTTNEPQDAPGNFTPGVR